MYEGDLQKSGKSSEAGDLNKSVNMLQGLTLKSEQLTKDCDDRHRVLNVTEGIIGSTRFLFVLDQTKNYYKERTNIIQKLILEHFDSMCKKLQNMLSLTSTAYKRLWLLYESYFFKYTMEHLYSVYYNAYLSSCKLLNTCMKGITAEDVQIENKSILQMLQNIKEDVQSVSPSTHLNQRKCISLKPEYKVTFTPALGSLALAVQQITPMSKFQYLSQCLKEISSASRSPPEDPEAASPPGADELLDFVILVLCNCDTDVLTSLFVDVRLLSDLVAPFLESGPHSYSLVTFYTALEYLLEKMANIKRRNAKKD